MGVDPAKMPPTPTRPCLLAGGIGAGVNRRCTFAVRVGVREFHLDASLLCTFFCNLLPSLCVLLNMLLMSPGLRPKGHKEMRQSHRTVSSNFDAAKGALNSRTRRTFQNAGGGLVLALRICLLELHRCNPMTA